MQEQELAFISLVPTSCYKSSLIIIPMIAMMMMISPKYVIPNAFAWQAEDEKVQPA